MTGREDLQIRLTDAHSLNNSLQDTGEFLKQVASSALYAAAQEPLKGMAQLASGGVNAAVNLLRGSDDDQTGVLSGRWRPNVDFMKAPTEAASGTADWYAQTIGGGLGQIIPLMLTAKVVKTVAPTLLGGAAESGILSRSRALGMTLGQSATTGFVNSAVFRESDPNKSLIGERLVNGTGGALTFAMMTAGSLALGGAAEMAASKPILAGFLGNRVLGGAVVGMPGAVLGTEFDSFMSTGHGASTDDLKKSAYSMALTGGMFGAKEAVFSRAASLPVAGHFPGFTADGLLPKGDHQLSWTEFTKRYGYNGQRQRFISELQELGGYVKNAGGREIRVGGSFVTTKASPGDFDAAWLPQGVDRDALPPFLSSGFKRCHGDFYPSDRDFPDIGIWDAALRRSAAGKEKGVISIDLSTLPSKPSDPATVESWRQANRINRAKSEELREQQKQEQILRQEKVDKLIAALPEAVLKGDDGIVRWLARFAGVNEGAHFDALDVARQLASAGHKPDASVGDPLVGTDRRVYGQWLIGQCLSSLSKGNPVRGFASQFAERYFQMSGTA